jgi:hypothetical protein
MATLRVFHKIDNDVWKLTFVNDPIELSDTDKKKMRQFGEPEIQVGGVYLENTGNEFALPTKTVRIRSDFPFTQEFDSTSTPFDTATQTKVEAYETAIVNRFTTALTTLRAIPDTFTGERTYNI